MNNIGWGLVVVSVMWLGALGCSVADKQISAADEQASAADERVEKKPPQTLEEVFGDAREGGGAQSGSGGPTPFGPGGPPPHGTGGSSTLEARPEMARTRPPTPEQVEERRRMQVRRKRLQLLLDLKQVAGEGRIKEAAVTKVLRRRRSAFVACYERGFKSGQDLEGYVGLRFSIGEDGRVSEAEITENTSKIEALGACLKKKLSRFRFPKPEGGVVTFSWGVRLNEPKSGGEAPVEKRSSPTGGGKGAAGRSSSKPTAIAGGLPDHHSVPHPWRPHSSKPVRLTPEEAERLQYQQFLNKHLKLPGSLKQLRTAGEGRIDPLVVRRSMAKYRGQFRHCYNSSVKDGRRVEGWIGFRFSIGENGRVSEAKIARNTSRNKVLVACLKRRLSGVRFPKPEGGAVKFHAVFLLEREKPQRMRKGGRPDQGGKPQKMGKIGGQNQGVKPKKMPKRGR